MKPSLLKFLLPPLLCAAATAQLYAQSTAFTYQGRLTDNGSPANGVYDLRFQIFDVESDGVDLQAVTNAATVVSDGLFTVTLDFGSDVFNGSDRWLEIGAVTDGGGAFTALLPRQQISSAPYAIQAANAMTVEKGTVRDPGFIGTTAETPLDLYANNQRGLRLEHASSPLGGESVSIIGGYEGNSISDGSPGAVIAGGGNASSPNSIGSNSYHAGIGGGVGNSIADGGALSSIGGGGNNRVGTNSHGATIGGGEFNSIADDATFGVISGGTLNEITNGAARSVISGGFHNTIGERSLAAAIGGGEGNSLGVNATYSMIGGGAVNKIALNTFGSSLLGGYQNEIGEDADFSMIGGGIGNIISSNASAANIVGGRNNSVGDASDFSTVGGGRFNEIGDSASYAVILGGYQNTIGSDADYAMASGNRAKANHRGAFVWADSTPADFASTGDDQFLIRSSGGVGINKNNPATELDVNGTVTATSFVGNGSGLTGLNIPDGHSLDASDGSPADRVFVNAAGRVGIGTTTPDSGKTMTIQGEGASSGWIQFQTSAGANEWHLAYAGGGMNFVETDVASERLFLQDGGNIGVGTGSPSQKLHVIGNILASGTITGSSDRNVKENFSVVDAQVVLEQVTAMPIQRWNYIGESTPHIGPVAQDFHAAFKVGMDDRHISMVDADGVALAAIQGLNQRVESGRQETESGIENLESRIDNLKSDWTRQLEQKDAEIRELKEKNANMLRRLETLEQRLKFGSSEGSI